MTIGSTEPQETPEAEEFAPTCESCGTETYPSQLREFKAGSRAFKDSKPIAVHVCPYCGLVTRDDDNESGHSNIAASGHGSGFPSPLLDDDENRG